MPWFMSWRLDLCLNVLIWRLDLCLNVLIWRLDLCFDVLISRLVLCFDVLIYVLTSWFVSRFVFWCLDVWKHICVWIVSNSHKFVICHTDLWCVTQIKTWHICDMTRVCLDLCDMSRHLYAWVMSRISMHHICESCLDFGCVIYATWIVYVLIYYTWLSYICYVTDSCDILIYVTVLIHSWYMRYESSMSCFVWHVTSLVCIRHVTHINTSCHT